MILPLGINHVIRGWPWVTLSIIATCLLVQIYSDTLAPSREAVSNEIVERLAQVPLDADEAQQDAAVRDVEQIANRVPAVRLGYPTGTGVSYRLVSSAFVHAGWLHLIGNMLFLWLAGAALEDKWGRARFAAFYVTGAIASTLCFDFFHSGSAALLVGASGAISALMGAFLVNFARMEIHCVYWIGFRAGAFDIVAYVALPLWLVEQLFYTWMDRSIGASGIAFMAHVGGFVFGVAAAGIAALIAKRGASADAPAATTATTDKTVLPVARAQVKRRPTTAVEATLSVEAPARPSALPPARPIEPPKQDPPVDPASGPRFLR